MRQITCHKNVKGLSTFSSAVCPQRQSAKYVHFNDNDVAGSQADPFGTLEFIPPLSQFDPAGCETGPTDGCPAALFIAILSGDVVLLSLDPENDDAPVLDPCAVDSLCNLTGPT